MKDNDRFFNIIGDTCVQLRPQTLIELGYTKLNKAYYSLHAPIRFKSDIAGGVIVIPKGFISDIASIPLWLQPPFMKSDDPRIALGAWVHDYLYVKRGNILLCNLTEVILTRDQCDRILTEEAMPHLMAKWWQCKLVYYALHFFGYKW
jgi:hypothetical protein